MLLRPRDPDARETITPAATEAELNNRLLQTTSSKEMLAIMREIRERQVANSEEQKTSRRHLPSTSKPCGIGYQTRPPLMKRFKAMISGLLGYIKELGIAPATWQRSSPVPLDKGTTKLGPACFRLVHLLCPFGKAFYGYLWRHRPHPCPRKVNTYAYSKGRRREAAILIQHMVRWRLTRGDVLAPIGTTMTGFDASNAFMSVHHTTLDKLVETSFEDERDRALMMQRYRGAQISLCANADEPRVEIVPSCGFLQGDVTGPSLFNDVYSEQIAKWEHCCEKEDRDAEYLHAKCFFTGDIYDASSTIFADDITKRTVTKTPQEVITKVSKLLKKHCRRYRDCHEPKQGGAPGRFCWSRVSQVDAHTVQGKRMA